MTLIQRLAGQESGFGRLAWVPTLAVVLSIAVGCVGDASADDNPPRGLQRFGTASPPRLFGGCSDCGVYEVEFVSNDDQIAVGESAFVRLWDLDSGLCTFETRTDRTVYSVEMSADRERLIWAGRGNTFAEVELASGATLREPRVGPCVSFHASYLRDGATIVSAGPAGRGAQGGCFYVWAQNDSSPQVVKTSSPVWKMAANRVNDTVVTGETSGQIYLWAIPEGSVAPRVLASTTLGSGRPQDMEISRDGRRLVVATSWPENTVLVLDATTLARCAAFERDTVARSVAISTDGSRIAIGGNEAPIDVIEIAKPRSAITLRGHDGGCSSLSFSTDGKRLASGGFRGEVMVWDVSDSSSTPSKGK